MCGIIGFTGDGDAIERLVGGLRALEYRGYDSAGVAFFEDGRLTSVKASGRIAELERRLGDVDRGNVTCGIGHTRWATHGEPSHRNAHPHGNGKVFGVHNGIIENYHEIGAFLEERGYAFESETDTERAVLLIEWFYRDGGDAVAALHRAADMMKGSFALGVVFSDRPDTVYAMRRDSPLLVCVSDEGTFIASDISAVLRYTRRFVRIDEGEVAVLAKDSVRFVSRDGECYVKDLETAEWDLGSAERGGYPHFMLKEIYEEPRAVTETLRLRIRDSRPVPETDWINDACISNTRRIHVVGCGTAMHAGLMGKHVIERLARIPVSVEIASEFRYNEPILCEGDVVILISQSGETADTLASLRLAKSRGTVTVAIVNVPGSAIAREADHVLYTRAGPEIAVASTKAYSVQTALLTLLAIRLGEVRGILSRDEVSRLCRELESLPKYITETLRLADRCRETAESYRDARSIFFIGRGHDYPLCMEAALKMKEISYIHCEAYAAGELKHGTIALIEKGTPVFAYATEKHTLDKTFSNIKEVRARGARVLLVTVEGYNVPDGVADDVIRIPCTDELMTPLCSVTIAQLLAYYTALSLGRDVDKPRNLAKSVTVE